MAISISCGGIVGISLTSSSPSSLVLSAQASCCSVSTCMKSIEEISLEEELELSVNELSSRWDVDERGWDDDDELGWDDDDELGWDGKFKLDGKLDDSAWKLP